MTHSHIPTCADYGEYHQVQLIAEPTEHEPDVVELELDELKTIEQMRVSLNGVLSYLKQPLLEVTP